PLLIRWSAMGFRTVPFIVALGVLLFAGLAHGLLTQRWQSSDALDAAVQRVATVPLKAGSWEATTVEADVEAFQQARALGYWTRRYPRPGVPGSISVILMCGRPGRMSVHTPDICSPGAGYEMVSEPILAPVALGPDGSSAAFWTARFRQPTRSA